MFIQKFIKSEFIRNVATMLSGNVLAQAIALLSAPIITRLYAPADFGIMTFILANASIFTVIACFRYRYAIVLPADDKKGYELVHISFFAVTITTLILLFGIIAFKSTFAQIWDFEQHQNFLFFIPVIVFFSGSREIFVFFHTRMKNFKLISLTTVLMPLTISGFKIGAGVFISASAFWLLLSNILGIVLSCLILVVFIKKYYFDIDLSFTFHGLTKTAKEYEKFPKYNMPTAFLNAISQNLPVFMFSYFFSQEIVGFYGLANMILRRPISIISQSTNNIFLQKSSEIKILGGDLYRNLKKVTVGLAIIGVIPFLFLTFSGKWLFGLFFGSDWSEAGIYAQILAPWLFVTFINGPANQVYTVMLALKFKLVWNILNIFLKIVSIILGYYLFNSPFGSIVCFSAVGVIMNVFFIIYAFKLVLFTKEQS